MKYVKKEKQKIHIFYKIEEKIVKFQLPSN
jgi:hypothetical protein